MDNALSSRGGKLARRDAEGGADPVVTGEADGHGRCSLQEVE